MTDPNDLGQVAIRRIAKSWQVDDDRVILSDEGFDWWPGNFRVSVRSHRSEKKEHGDAWRLSVRTAFLKGVEIENPVKRERLVSISRLSPTFAWVFTPVEISEKYGNVIDRAVELVSTVYLREDTANWLPEFLARLAILQPIQAQRMAERTAQLIGGEPDVSVPSETSLASHRDAMLNVSESLYIPAGKQVSRWINSGEFAELAERFGKNDLCFGTGDPTGATLETPFGSESALIRLRTDAPHPILGSGLLATVMLPFWQAEADIAEQCMWLNYFQSLSWSDVPLLGSWHPKERGAGQFHSTNAIFLPNSLYKTFLATNAGLWQVAHARWAKQQIWSHLTDLTMLQILEKRYGSLSNDSPE